MILFSWKAQTTSQTYLQGSTLGRTRMSLRGYSFASGLCFFLPTHSLPMVHNVMHERRASDRPLYALVGQIPFCFYAYCAILCIILLNLRKPLLGERAKSSGRINFDCLLKLHLGIICLTCAEECHPKVEVHFRTASVQLQGLIIIRNRHRVIILPFVSYSQLVVWLEEIWGDFDCLLENDNGLIVVRRWAVKQNPSHTGVQLTENVTSSHSLTRQDIHSFCMPIAFVKFPACLCASPQLQYPVTQSGFAVIALSEYRACLMWSPFSDQIRAIW